MKDLIIVCAGSVAVEAYYAIKEINKYELERGRNAKYNVLGFISDDPNALAERPYVKLPILGTIADWKPLGNETYVLGIATPKSKEKLVSLLTARGCNFETIISPFSSVNEDVIIGKGCFIQATSYISAGAKIGDYVNIMGSMIGSSAVIGDYSTTLGYANVATGKLGKRVYVGSHAVILKTTVGDDAVVSVGSVVITKVKQGTKVFGSPAVKVDW